MTAEMVLFMMVKLTLIGVMLYAICVLLAYGRLVLPDAFEPIAGLYVIQLSLSVLSLRYDIDPRYIDMADWAWMLYSFALPVLVTKIIMNRRRVGKPHRAI